MSTIIKNVLNMTNSTDPDETPHFAASHLGLRYMLMLPFLDFFILHKCNKHVPRIVYIDFFGKLFCGVSSGSSLFVNAPFFYFFLINAITTSQQLHTLILGKLRSCLKWGLSHLACVTPENPTISIDCLSRRYSSPSSTSSRW